MIMILIIMIIIVYKRNKRPRQPNCGPDPSRPGGRDSGWGAGGCLVTHALGIQPACYQHTIVYRPRPRQPNCGPDRPGQGAGIQAWELGGPRPRS